MQVTPVLRIFFFFFFFLAMENKKKKKKREGLPCFGWSRPGRAFIIIITLTVESEGYPKLLMADERERERNDELKP